MNIEDAVNGFLFGGDAQGGELGQLREMRDVPAVELQILRRTRESFSFISSLQTEGLISGDIHLVHQEFSGNFPQIDAQQWQLHCNGTVREYQGVGSHQSMVSAQYAERNAGIIREIIESR